MLELRSCLVPAVRKFNRKCKTELKHWQEGGDREGEGRGKRERRRVREEKLRSIETSSLLPLWLISFQVLFMRICFMLLLLLFFNTVVPTV